MKKTFEHIVKDKDIYIYGAGSNGRKIADVLIEAGYKIKNFIDQSAKTKQTYSNIEPILPFTLTKEQAKTSLVIISIFNRDADIKKIINFCREECGFIEVLTLWDILEYFFEKTGNFYWASSKSNNTLSQTTIDQCLQLFADDLSCSIFKQTVDARTQRDFSLLPHPAPITEQYFSENVPLHSCKSFVDVGAFDGDSIDAMKKRFGKINQYIGIEADVDNFQKLVTKVRGDHFYEQAFLYPCALWSRNRMLKMNTGNGESSTCSSTGTSMVQAVALDDIMLGLQAGYIKMDIEGAEYEALLGAKQTITKYKPDLAICVYHTPEHLFQIPLLLHSWNLGYTFYLRQYGYCGLELVLYAINN